MVSHLEPMDGDFASTEYGPVCVRFVTFRHCPPIPEHSSLVATRETLAFLFGLDHIHVSKLERSLWPSHYPKLSDQMTRPLFRCHNGTISSTLLQ